MSKTKKRKRNRKITPRRRDPFPIDISLSVHVMLEYRTCPCGYCVIRRRTFDGTLGDNPWKD